jgi:hypothetical protein
LQPLLLKAKTLDLVEVLAKLVGGYVVHRVPGHRLVAAARRSRRTMRGVIMSEAQGEKGG